MIKTSDKLTILRLSESVDVNEGIKLSWEKIRGISLEQRDMRVIHLNINVDRNIILKTITAIFPQRAHDTLFSVVGDIREKSKRENKPKG